MAIVKQFDKRCGITYVYESKTHWDKELKKNITHRKLIGRLDTETGEIVATRGKGRIDKKKEAEPGSIINIEIDYKELSEKLMRKIESQDILIAALQKELLKLKEQR